MGLLGHNRKENVKAIRSMLKKEAPTLSIRMAKGTARSWVDVSGSKDQFGNFTIKEKSAFTKFGLRPTSVLSPEEQSYLLGKRRK